MDDEADADIEEDGVEPGVCGVFRTGIVALVPEGAIFESCELLAGDVFGRPFEAVPEISFDVVDDE